jgi:hypothetical protein
MTGLPAGRARTTQWVLALVVIDPLVAAARDLAASQLCRLPERLRHVESVARAAESLNVTNGFVGVNELIAAAWLHDIGYSPSIAAYGFHPLDGAIFLREASVPELVVSLVAYHSESAVEAEERGLSSELAAFARPPTYLLDRLTFADMTTGPDGEHTDVDSRIDEILSRYDSTDPVFRAITRSTPNLKATVARVQLENSGAGH